MPKVLFISHTNMLGVGTTHSLLLLTKFLRSKYDMGVVLVRDVDDLSILLRKEKVSFFKLPKRTILFLPSLMYLIVKWKYDLVYGNNFSGRCKVALWAAKLTRRPFIWHIRESLTEKSNIRFIPYADVIIANSLDTANRIRKYVPGQVVRIIPNGVDLEDYCIERNDARKSLHKSLNLKDESLIFINVGLICQRKNQLHTIEAAAHALESFPDIVFIFLGNIQERDYRASLDHRIEQLGLQKNILFLDFKQNVSDYLLGADVLVHTAQKEPQGRVILEAMASRLPVIAYDVGGVGEAILPGETGFLLPFGNIDMLANSMKELIKNPKLRQRMGNNGYQRVSELFTAEKTAQQVCNLIDRLTNKD